MTLGDRETLGHYRTFVRYRVNVMCDPIEGGRWTIFFPKKRFCAGDPRPTVILSQANISTIMELDEAGLAHVVASGLDKFDGSNHLPLLNRLAPGTKIGKRLDDTFNPDAKGMHFDNLMIAADPEYVGTNWFYNNRPRQRDLHAVPETPSPDDLSDDGLRENFGAFDMLEPVGPNGMPAGCSDGLLTGNPLRMFGYRDAYMAPEVWALVIRGDNGSILGRPTATVEQLADSNRHDLTRHLVNIPNVLAFRLGAGVLDYKKLEAALRDDGELNDLVGRIAVAVQHRYPFTEHATWDFRKKIYRATQKLRGVLEPYHATFLNTSPEALEKFTAAGHDLKTALARAKQVLGAWLI